MAILDQGCLDSGYKITIKLPTFHIEPLFPFDWRQFSSSSIALALHGIILALHSIA